MLKKICLALMLTFAANCAYADATVLGFKMGEATISQFKEKFSGEDSRENDVLNKWTMGPMYQIRVSEIPIEHLKSALAIFDANEKLVAVELIMYGDQVMSMHKHLKKKYKVVKAPDCDPFCMMPSASYKDGNTLIDLKVEGFDTDLLYIQKSVKDKWKSDVNDMIKEQEKKEADML